MGILLHGFSINSSVTMVTCVNYNSDGTMIAVSESDWRYNTIKRLQWLTSVWAVAEGIGYRCYDGVGSLVPMLANLQCCWWTGLAVCTYYQTLGLSTRILL